jgi:hypothetical protein
MKGNCLNVRASWWTLLSEFPALRKTLVLNLDCSRAASTISVLSLLLVWLPRPALGSVGGSIGDLVRCGSSSVLYTNATSLGVNIELAVSNENGASGCSETLSWTDASGQAQGMTVPAHGAISVSTSVEPNGTLSWKSAESSGQYVSLIWQIERAPAQSVAGQMGTGFRCGSSGTAYSNLTSATVNLDFGTSAETSNGCTLTFTWTDAEGVPHTLNLGLQGSQGISTSLPAGGVISWESTTAKAYVAASWQIERVDTSQLW